MHNANHIGPLVRIIRLQHNWSLETLASGICSVSYLSKIEQGKADTNPALMKDIFGKLGLTWQDDPNHTTLRNQLYEGIFSWDDCYTKQQFSKLEQIWPENAIGPCYVDFLIIRAYVLGNTECIQEAFLPCLNNQQKALYFIINNDHTEAYRIFPCPLTAFCVGEEAYMKGNYTHALEYLQIACDQAAKEGYVYLHAFAESYIANCYSDIGNMEVMYRHSEIAARLGRILGMEEFVRTIEYNIAATKLEFGNYEDAYHYFSGLSNPGFMDLHKLSICCEELGKLSEAFSALKHAEKMDAADIERQMLSLVRYRLEHPNFLHDQDYGVLLLNVYNDTRKYLHTGYARFHLRWVTEWLTANRQYRKAYEILSNFPRNHF